jgi:hypothetical protein
MSQVRGEKGAKWGALYVGLGALLVGFGRFF